MSDARCRGMRIQVATAAKAQIEKITRDITELIQREGNVKAVFGEPVQLDSHVIIPVAAVHMNLGGGGAGGAGLKNGIKEKLMPFGVGGGLGLQVHAIPVGFISESAEGATFTPIPRASAPQQEDRHDSLVGRILREIEQRKAASHDGRG